ncbi:uncharacterized protein LOC142486476 [Ascaphus truei]|uniref:uncharacterized protein LOC142486476 n=1 Tax=Ascaphus truei TaxID=8439 RepID=UPI003F59866A
MRYVRLTIHNKKLRLLKLRTVSKRNYYLQLQQKYPDQVFQLWARLSHILHHGLSITCKDPSILLPFSFIHSSVGYSSSSEDSTWEDLELSDEKNIGMKVTFDLPSDLGREPADGNGLAAGGLIRYCAAKASSEASSQRSREESGSSGGSCSRQEGELSIQEVPAVSLPSATDEGPRQEAPQKKEGMDQGLCQRDAPSGTMSVSLLSLVTVGQSKIDIIQRMSTGDVACSEQKWREFAF